MICPITEQLNCKLVHIGLQAFKIRLKICIVLCKCKVVDVEPCYEHNRAYLDLYLKDDIVCLVRSE